MDALVALHAGGQIRPVIYRTYPLHDAAAALRALGERESYGKVVLVP
jgi:NADPH:quinone reductase-like Zn-dependent oxidoreductase